jgi:hypothetical protein
MAQTWQPGEAGTCFTDPTKDYYPLFAIWLILTTNKEQAKALLNNTIDDEGIAAQDYWAGILNMRPECLKQIVDQIVARDAGLAVCQEAASIFQPVWGGNRGYCPAGCPGTAYGNIAALGT